MKKVLWADKPLLQTGGENGCAYESPENPAEERARWERTALPLGNGRLGCTLYGDPRCERIQFNEDSLWVGNEHNTGAYQPFGDVYIHTGHDQYGNYRRELDIEQALQTITYTSGGVEYRRECCASYPAQAIIMRLTADRPGSLSGSISMGSLHDVPVVTEEATLVMKGDTRGFWYWTEHLATPERRLSGREYASEEIIPLDFEARVSALHAGGSLTTKTDRLVFCDCDSITLILVAGTSYVADRSKGWTGEHPHAAAMRHVSDAAGQSFDDLLAQHVSDFQSIFGRMTLEVGGGCDEHAASTTLNRVTAYADAVREGQQSGDRDLEVLLYDYARYLMICSSRPGHGALPANLQGIWCMNKRPSWRCDFHTDVNIQMNYWFAPASNLADCLEPFARWIDSIREVRKEETEKVLGVKRGWLMRSENGIFGGSTWHIQKGDSAWLCQNLWDCYTFTQDKAYLGRYAYPVMKEICEFWSDHLKALPDGVLVVPEGRSPEHGPIGVDGVTYDQVLCWDLFNNTIEASEVLGVDVAFRNDLVDKRDRLLGPQVGQWGQLQEWMEDRDDPEDDHRHINHLICVYPGRQVHPDIDPNLAEAARASVTARHRHGAGHPGWSKVWKACIFARLRDGETAYQLLADIIATRVYGNLWATHPPFQIDCNFGYAAAVNEMLVQSHVEVASREERVGSEGRPVTGGAEGIRSVHLLPALPKAWAAGRVAGMRVRGGFELAMEWARGALKRAEIRNVGRGEASCLLRYGDKTKPVAIAAGDTTAVGPGDFLGQETAAFDERSGL